MRCTDGGADSPLAGPFTTAAEAAQRAQQELMSSSTFVEEMKQHQALNDFLQLYTAMQQIYHAKLQQCIQQCARGLSIDSTASLAYAFGCHLLPDVLPARDANDSIRHQDLNLLVQHLGATQFADDSATLAALAKSLAETVLNGKERPLTGLILPDILSLLTIATQPEAMFGTKELAQLQSGKLLPYAGDVPSCWGTEAGQAALRQQMEQLLLFTLASNGPVPCTLGKRMLVRSCGR